MNGTYQNWIYGLATHLKKISYVIVGRFIEYHFKLSNLLWRLALVGGADHKTLNPQYSIGLTDTVIADD